MWDDYRARMNMKSYDLLKKMVYDGADFVTYKGYPIIIDESVQTGVVAYDC